MNPYHSRRAALEGKVVRRLPVVRHLTVERVEAAYRACQHPIEKTRWHAIGLLLRTDTPRTPAQVADLVGLSVITTRDILKRWNQNGPDGLADGRKNNGLQSKLDADQRARLLAVLKKRPPDGGLWSGPKVVAFVREKWQVEICPQTGWKWLVDLGFTLQVPRPSHPKAAGPATQKRWKKTYASD
jgi:transposase